MNEYNEKALRLILEDYIYENDEALQKEIEEAAANPLFAADEDKAKAFAEKYGRKRINIPKKAKKILYSAAAFVLVLLVSFSVIPFEAGSQQTTVLQYVFDEAEDGAINLFLSSDINENIKRYDGVYIPTWIPEGYYIDQIQNHKDAKMMVFKNDAGKNLVFSEDSLNASTSIDCDDENNIQEVEILGFKGIYVENDGDESTLFVATNECYILVHSNDPEVDLIGFARMIEKRS